MKKITLVSLLCFAFSVMQAQAPVQPIGIGEELGNFELESFQGQKFNISDMKGDKNILLIFPRGLVLKNLWCPICYYQYAEIAAIDKKENLRKKLDLEILYVLPYPKDSVALWHQAAQAGLNTVENWKNPNSYEIINEDVQGWIDYTNEFFPQTFELKDGELELPIPVLMDEDKAVSRGMALFTKEWGGTEADQNMPTIFIVNKEGKVVFKYHSQYTNDRPTARYLLEIMKKLL